ncbi:MAG TPA: hypothetical protein VKA27_16035 [Sunxiuqinia sp.]|nr:hypothetical protein [Sunxiuqinia sp.]
MNSKNPPLIFILLMIFWLPFTTFAQPDESLDDKTLNKDSYLTVNLFSPINTLNPRWRIGYIQHLSTRWKAGIDFSFGNREISFSDFGNKIENAYQLWGIRPELYYLLRSRRRTQKYISAELFYIHHKDTYHDNFIISRDRHFNYYEQARFKRQKFGAHIKAGIFQSISKRLGLNIYAGFGFRFRYNSFSNIMNPSQRRDIRDMFVFDYNEIEGLNLNVDFSLGFKLFYLFKN